MYFILIGYLVAGLCSLGTLRRRSLLLDSAADDFPLLGSGSSGSCFLGAATASLSGVVRSAVEEVLLNWPRRGGGQRDGCRRRVHL